MKVLMFGWEFPPHISGGLGTACQGIVNGLLENGVRVLFVVPKTYGDEPVERFRLLGAEDVHVWPDKAAATTLREALSFFEVDSPLVPYMSPEAYIRQTAAGSPPAPEHRPIRYTFGGGYGKNLMREVWHYAETAAAIASRQAFDIIHAHDWLAFPAGIMAAAQSGKPLVVHVHATEFDRAGDNINRQVYETEKQGMMMADRVIAVSELTRQTIIHRYHIPPEKVVTIHNAVNQSEEPDSGFSLPSLLPEKRVCFAGRVTWQKNPSIFVEAATRILEKDKSFRFFMAGSGDMLDEMIEKANRLEISSRFHFTGFLQGPALQKLLRACDVFVMPSVSEPFGLAPLEAIREGVPVIVSRQSGVQEVLQYAMKVDWWDVDALANAIYGLARYRGLANMLRRESIREVSEMSWLKQAAAIKSLYRKVLNCRV
ncbi:glycosyltransferase family 4 protein [Chitinophaga pollutisoli]|uniref:Glycosyltransferase family 4 protein n=1 Tax=Chitinophaga pollutisoli TaxID=3133966 RepID=A0ABZ2YM06_9BACT